MNKIRFSNAVLKNIAYVSMFVDHFFAVVYRDFMRRYAAAAAGTAQENEVYRQMDEIYRTGRAIGRIAFILFAYLAAEGFAHTGNRKKYLLRLGGFALISELPFDLAFSGKCFDWGSQNVYFTLSLGIAVLMVWEWAAENRWKLLKKPRPGDMMFRLCVGVFAAIQFGALFLGCGLAYCMRTDYKYMGVLLIVVFYLLRRQSFAVKIAAAGAVMLFGTWSANCLRYAGERTMEYLFWFSMREMYGLAAFVPIFLYDGSKGKQLPKAVCYGFYPVHLLLLRGIVWLTAGI